MNDYLPISTVPDLPYLSEKANFELSNCELLCIATYFSLNKPTSTALQKLFKKLQLNTREIDKLTLHPHVIASLSKDNGASIKQIFSVLKYYDTFDGKNQVIPILQKNFPKETAALDRYMNNQQAQKAFSIIYTGDGYQNIELTCYYLSRKKKWGIVCSFSKYVVSVNANMMNAKPFPIDEDADSDIMSQLLACNINSYGLIRNLFLSSGHDFMLEQLRECGISEEVEFAAKMAEGKSLLERMRPMVRDDGLYFCPQMYPEKDLTIEQIAYGSVIQYLFEYMDGINDYAHEKEAEIEEMSKTIDELQEAAKSVPVLAPSPEKEWKEKYNAVVAKATKQTNRILSMEDTISKLSHENEILKNRIKALEQSHSEIQEQEDTCAMDCIDEQMFREQEIAETVALSSNLKIVVIGGHQNWVANMKGTFPKISYYGTDNFPPISTIANADIVVVKTEYMNHAQFERAKTTCATKGIPFVYAANGQSVYQFAKSLSEAIKGVAE